MRGRKRTAVTLAVIGPSTGLLAGGGSRSHTNAATAAARAVAEYMTPAEAIYANRSASETIVGNTDGTSPARAQAAIATETAAAKDVLVTIEALTPPAPRRPQTTRWCAPVTIRWPCATRLSAT